MRAHAVLASMVEDIDDRGEGLTEWEIGFISGLVDDPPDEFTPSQAEKIEQIWKERV